MTTVAQLGLTADPVGLVGAAGLLGALPAWRPGAGRSAAAVAAALGLLLGTCVWPGSLAGTSLTGYAVHLVLLLIVVPTVLAVARPPVRVPGNPGLSLLLVPVVTALVVFTPVLDLATGSLAGRDGVALVLLVAGCLAAFPLTQHGSSLGIGLALLLSVAELIADAVPGLVLRLMTHPLHAATVLGAAHGHAALADQQQAGGVLWAVAELVDLPVLVLLLRSWIRADAREAREADVLDEAHRVVEPTGLWWEQDGRLGARRSQQLRRR